MPCCRSRRMQLQMRILTKHQAEIGSYQGQQWKASHAPIWPVSVQQPQMEADIRPAKCLGTRLPAW